MPSRDLPRPLTSDVEEDDTKVCGMEDGWWRVEVMRVCGEMQWRELVDLICPNY